MICHDHKNLWYQIISITARVVGDPDANPPVQSGAAKKTTGATFQINKAKLYVSVLTLSIMITSTF